MLVFKLYNGNEWRAATVDEVTIHSALATSQLSVVKTLLLWWLPQFLQVQQSHYATLAASLFCFNCFTLWLLVMQLLTLSPTLLQHIQTFSSCFSYFNSCFVMIVTGCPVGFMSSLLVNMAWPLIALGCALLLWAVLWLLTTPLGTS